MNLKIPNRPTIWGAEGVVILDLYLDDSHIEINFMVMNKNLLVAEVLP